MGDVDGWFMPDSMSRLVGRWGPFMHLWVRIRRWRRQGAMAREHEIGLQTSSVDGHQLPGAGDQLSVGSPDVGDVFGMTAM